MPQPKSGRSSSSSAKSRSSAASTRGSRAGSSSSGGGARKSSGRSASGRGGSSSRKSTSSSRASTARSGSSTARSGSSTSRSGTSRPSTARKSTSRSRSGSSARTRSTASRSRAGSARPQAQESASQARTDENVARTVALLREHLTRGIVLTAERLQEALDDTVRRGRITRDDAEDLLQSLVSIGRKQTEGVLNDLEQLFGRSPGGVAQAARDAGRRAAEQARGYQGADRLLQEVDRARRAARIGPAFPITAYDNLSATQIAARLDQLTDPQLRKVRDYERRNQNRKSVIDAIERRLQS